ncbi:MAG TPA: FecR domain-containing protein [Planctomycetota bacterium]|jgi:hypothetical protein|nr:FecR domain-containing protein [Planctomycetota bacterium]
MSEGPRDDYLWDPKGSPDPEIERLERAFGPLRWRERPLLALPGRRRPALAAAAAASLLLAGGLGWAILGRGRGAGGEVGGFFVETLRGEAQVAAGDGMCREGAGRIRSGDRIRCGPGASARVRVGPIGSIELEERSALRIERGDDEAYGVFLERGSLSASIFAAPRVFQVGTPSGIAVDLGCVYRTTVDEEGRTTLAVLSGRVSFEVPGRKVLVPARASCRAYPDRGPGTPVWVDAPERYRACVERLDAGADPEALGEVLSGSRPKDSLTLWHLLGHGDEAVRQRAFDRLAGIRAPPAGLRRDGVKDRKALERWRDEIERFW